MTMQNETLRQTLVEAATTCNDALPDRIRSSGGVCQVSLEVGSGLPLADKLRVVITLEGGYHHIIEVTQPNALDLIRQSVDCMGLLEDWFDAGNFSNKPSGSGP